MRGDMGQIWAWGTFFVGLCTGGFAWACSSRMKLSGWLMTLTRMAFSVIVALAAFSNLAFAAWATGQPIDLGIVRDGRMAAYYWLGPFTLLYAVILGVILKKAAEKTSFM